jgi:hypothetical protein
MDMKNKLTCALCVCILRWFIFWKNKNPQKSIFQCQNFDFFKYHQFNDNKVHMSKVINAILIESYLHIPYVCVCYKIKIWETNNYVKDLWKYGSISTIQKSLIRIWLWFLREVFHIKTYYLKLRHILSHYR